MPDPSQIPHLLRLLDDNSPLVQQSVWRELTAYGPDLEDNILRLELAEQDDILSMLRHRDFSRRRENILHAWAAWFSIRNEKPRLEKALDLLSDFQAPYSQPGRLAPRLDALAEEFRDSTHFLTSQALAQFLFQEKGFRGAQENYYVPDKSDLVHVIETRRGNPISLTAIYMLVGHRLGIDIQGCDFPGHFMARIIKGHRAVLVDCFNGGRVYFANDFLDLSPEGTSPARETLHRPAPVTGMVVRVLNNLHRAYLMGNDIESGEFMLELKQQIKSERTGSRSDQ